jgi:hypothetical protein
MALRLMQDATHLVSNTPFVRFKVRFIRFGQSHPVKSRSKVVSLPPRNNYAKDMFPKNTKILNWQNGLLLSAAPTRYTSSSGYCSMMTPPGSCWT